jgi:hypothetical protein
MGYGLPVTGYGLPISKFAAKLQKNIDMSKSASHFPHF